MKKIIVTFGLISGFISAGLMAVTVPFEHKIGYDHGLVIGYTAIVLSFLLVFFGVRSYRENVGGGSISFGRAFAVGISITLISCIFYVVSWEILYYFFMPNFMDNWIAGTVQKAQAAGESAAAIQIKVQQLQHYKELYANPLINAAMTFIEPFPVGLVITLISSVTLRRRPKVGAPPIAATS